MFETTVAPGLFAHDLAGELYTPRTGSEFTQVLHNVIALTRRGHAPILHIEAHGDEAGLQLTSNEVVSWETLAPILATINEACQMNLLVVAAACHGWHLGSVLRPIHRAPAFGVLGPPKSADPDPLYRAMQRFYQHLLRHLDLSGALREANEGRPIDEWDYRITSADLVFCQVMQQYMGDLKEGETQEQRVNRLVTEVARVQHLDVMQTMVLRAEIKDHLDDHRYWFDRYRTHFLMLDLFPKNAGRFPLSFDECNRLFGPTFACTL